MCGVARDCCESVWGPEVRSSSPFNLFSGFLLLPLRTLPVLCYARARRSFCLLLLFVPVSNSITLCHWPRPHVRGPERKESLSRTSLTIGQRTPHIMGRFKSAILLSLLERTVPGVLFKMRRLFSLPPSRPGKRPRNCFAPGSCVRLISLPPTHHHTSKLKRHICPRRTKRLTKPPEWYHYTDPRGTRVLCPHCQQGAVIFTQI